MFSSCNKETDRVLIDADDTLKVSDGSNIMPLNKGAWFKYYFSEGQISGTYTKSIIGDKVINGKKYAEFYNSYDKSLEYYREANGVLYSKGNSLNEEIKQVGFNAQSNNEDWSFEFYNFLTYYGNEYKHVGNNFEIDFKNTTYKATKIEIKSYEKSIRGLKYYVSTSYIWYVKGIGKVLKESSGGIKTELIDYGTN